MTNPARSHYEKSMAQRAAKAGDAPATNDAHALLLVALGDDLRRLSDIRSVEGKIAAKADMIGRYAGWVRGAINAGVSGDAIQDDIIAYVMIWALDLQNWDYAHEIAMHMFKYDLQLPERFHNNVATLLVDEVADAALKRQIEVPKNIIQKTIEMTMDEDVTDQANAKLYRILGDSFAADLENYDDENPPNGGKAKLVETALSAYKRALQLNSKVGVKKNITSLESLAKKLKETEPETGDAETGDAETGDAETGDTETGDAETGDTETGDAETGDAETGDAETGDAETGDTE